MTRAVITCAPALARAKADVASFIRRHTPKPYSRTVLAQALMSEAERMINGDSPIRGVAREVLAEEACQLWAKLLNVPKRSNPTKEHV